jgi:hypothetical protein
LLRNGEKKAKRKAREETKKIATIEKGFFEIFPLKWKMLRLPWSVR